MAQDQAEYISSNESSLKEAEENADIARPFAIYIDDKMVGFTMLAFDEEYEDYEAQQKSFYQDRPVEKEPTQSHENVQNRPEPVKKAPVEQPKPAPKQEKVEHNVMDDYPDDGFGPDPFAVPFSESSSDKDDDFPDEFGDSSKKKSDSDDDSSSVINTFFNI